MDEFHVAWPFLIPIVSIIGAFTYAVVQTLARARVRELEVRERIAMIERGLVPPPEVDPRGFDRAVRDTLAEWKCVAEGNKYQASVEINFTLKDE